MTCFLRAEAGRVGDVCAAGENAAQVFSFNQHGEDQSSQKPGCSQTSRATQNKVHQKKLVWTVM